MPTRKSYKGTAVAAKLTSGINSGALSFDITVATGWPDGITPAFPFVACIGRGTSTEEKVLCSSRTGLTVTVNASGRGYDGTTAAAHVAGEDVEHTVDATTLTDLSAHAYGTGTDHSGLSLSGHTHSLSYGTPVAVGAANADGADTALARRDHVHQGSRFICTSGTRPGSPFEGLVIYETDTDKEYIYTGSAWYFTRRPASMTGLTATGSSIVVQDVYSAVTWTETVDTDAFITGLSTTVTIPSGFDGYYAASFRGQWTVLLAVETIGLIVHTRSAVNTVYGAVGTQSPYLNVHAGLHMLAGDTLTVQVFHHDVTSRTINSTLSLVRLG